MKMSSKILVVASAGAAAAVSVIGPYFFVISALSPTSPIRRCVESCLSAVERSGRFFAKLIGFSEMLEPRDANLAYLAYLLIYFALVGAVLAVCGYLGMTLLLKFLGLRGVKRRGGD
ncbi:MAG: hypothetical protein N3J91_03340 [Verrucomicrobiae bacterium]|nr:hypothetical protein [Verrucomicrobiae bacterium]